MLNDKLMIRMSEHLAKRAANTSAELPQQIMTMYQMTLGREPTPKEARAFADYAKKYGTANACRVILNSNEFMFVN